VANNRYKHLSLVVGYIGLFVIVVLSLVPGMLRPDTGMEPWMEHFAAYSLVGVAFGLGLRYRGLAIICGGALSVVAGLLEELQHFSPGRHPEISGFLASSAGAWTGLMLSIFLTGLIERDSPA
jgi:VanZ family protein